MSRRFDPSEPIGRGHTVIEASAGTGKTFTIAAIVARLIAEEGVPIDRILLITFTRAATAELKARVRNRLVAVVEAIEGGARGGDAHMEALLSSIPHAGILDRVGTALTHFDRAQVFTIDGFGRRLLGELGFGSRLPVELEPGGIDRKSVV